MASSTRIPKAELTGLYGALVKRMSRKMVNVQVPPGSQTLPWNNSRRPSRTL